MGCADGTMLRILSPHFKVAYGVEADALAFPNQAPNVISARAEALPFANDSFNTVICSATRKHLRDPIPVVAEMTRVLRPRGRLIILDPNPLLVQIGMKLGKFDSRYIRNNSWARQIRNEMESFGLRTIHAKNGLFVQCVGEKPSPVAR